jgi:hypothetical protein
MESLYPYICAAVGIGLYLYFEDMINKHHIRKVLAENDRMWTDMVNNNLKTIAEAYQDGKPVTFHIERI